MRSFLHRIAMGVFLCTHVVAAQTTSTSPTVINFPSTPVGTSRDSSFMVYAGGMTYGTNYRLYITPSTGFQISWSPIGPFQSSSLMLQLATTTGYQSWCYVRYAPTSPNMVGTITVQITYGHPTYAFIFESQMGLNQVLPVQLVSFKGLFNAGDNAVILSWKTLSETANYGFEVQRKAVGENNFTGLPDGFVPGHGTILVPQEYEFTDHHPVPGHAQYRLKQIDLDGSYHFSDPVGIDVVTNSEGSAGAPERAELMQNYPNPFNPETVIRYQVPEIRDVKLTVHDALGREVMVLVDGRKPAGNYEVKLDGSALSSGIYFYRLQAGSFTQTRSFMLLR